MYPTTSIDEATFKLWFPPRAQHAWELLQTKPVNSKELLFEYLPSKLWRLNNLYSIINKSGERVPFKMNSAQFYVYSHSLIHPRIIVLKSRQRGISTLWLISFIDDVLTLKNIKSGLMAQDKGAAGGLLERVKDVWENVDPEIKGFLGLRLVKDNSEEFKFSNNSNILINTSFRSATLQRLHISELGKIANKYPEKAKETRTGTLQTIAPGNTVVIESTAEGANIFKHMWDSAVKQKTKNDISLANGGESTLAAKDFYPVFLSWVDDPDCVEPLAQEIDINARNYFTKVENELGVQLRLEKKNFWIAQERELEGSIYQEYPATPAEAFSAAKDGTYWARKYIQQVLTKGHRRKKLYDPQLEVYIACDLGRNDYLVLLFFQFFDNEIRIVGEYYNSGEDIKHYADYILEREQELGWAIKDVALPHDATAVVLGAYGKSREEQFNEAGITNTTVLSKEAISVSIDEVRLAMSDIYIDETCSYIEQCILNYSKEWNSTLEIFKDEPKKSEYSHGADAVRYMVQYCSNYLGYTNQGKEEIELRPAKRKGGICL